MDLNAVLSAVKTWPPEDQLRLIEEVWDGLTEADDGPRINEEVRALLEQRLAFTRSQFRACAHLG
jgi:hypothetical protein